MENVMRSNFGKLFISKSLKLDNMTIIVDRNNYQQTGKNSDILDLKNLKSKFTSFGCDTFEINGHDIKKNLFSFIKKNTKKNLEQL